MGHAGKNVFMKKVILISVAVIIYSLFIGSFFSHYFGVSDGLGTPLKVIFLFIAVGFSYFVLFRIYFKKTK